jgi:GPH family glycoside/pentoside/hexuronide:cation symporter
VGRHPLGGHLPLWRPRMALRAAEGDSPRPLAEPEPRPDLPSPGSRDAEAQQGRAGRVPLGIKLAYGAPSFAGAAMAIPIGIHLTIFYSDVVLVPLGWIALVKALSRALDALTDPLMGWLTDRTRSRWGRRRPYLALGAPACALAFLALFAPPAALTPSGATSWLLATYVLYYLFHTVYIIPHYGLGPELTQDYHERSRLYGVQEAFTVAGTMVAAALPGLLVDQFGFSQRDALTLFALVFGTLLTLLYWNLIARVRERRDFAERPPNALVPGLRRVMRNHVFRILLAVYVIGSTTGAIPGMMMPYFTTYVLRPEQPALWLTIFLVLYFGAGFVFLPFWVWFARRFSKKTAYLVTFIPGLLGGFLLFFMGEGQLLETGVILVFAGSVFGARLFLGPALQADVIDYDELHTGKRREAQYGALWAFMTKFTVIPSMSIPLAVLASLGYAPNTEQSETVTFAIRAIFGLLPASTALLAFVVAWRYPITEDIHRRIWEGIGRHREGLLAEDPVTGKPLAPPTGRTVDEDTGWLLDHFSRGELRILAERGPGALARRPALWCTLCSLLTAVAGSSIFITATDLASDPGLYVVLEVVAAGFALAFAVYHGIRLRTALALRREPVDIGKVHLHLEALAASL